MKKLLVLGATGFIGRNIVEYFSLLPNYQVYGSYFRSDPLDNSNVIMIQADLTEKRDVEKIMKGMDLVIQAAAITSGIKDVAQAPHKIIAENAIMNSWIFRSAFDFSIPHLILLSCTVMYHSSAIPLKENDFDANREIYPSYFGGAWNKVYFEKMCEFYSSLGRNKFTALRHSNIYGPYDKYDLEKSHAFGATMTKVMTEKNGIITVWGKGEEKRDLLYVSDLVKFIELVISHQNSPYELYNVGYGISISINDLVKKIIDCSGKRLSIEHDLSKPSNETELCLDCSKAKQELGWEPEVSLKEGIKKTMKWYQQNLFSINTE